ncbi:ribonuclease H [Senna tora]|uniref:Ribonuclease H n=1 Tax=Senna tora TaxID=362788 RepID=A0A834TCX1_9FABA|nr:ribonuclease H [Senna tora]
MGGGRRSVPPSRSNRADVWAWNGEANGSFSVKSCYKLAMEESWKQINLTPHMFCDVPSDMWKILWKLLVLSRFKVLLWRACLEILPTVDALERRVLNSVWGNAPFNFNGKESHASILEWMVVEWSEWSKDQRGWKVDRCWDEVITAETMLSTSQNQTIKLTWTKPTNPFIKLNVDIAVNHEGEGVVGGVFRDHESSCVGAFSGKVAAMGDVALMEAVGLRKGIEVAREGGISHLCVETDSNLVVDMLHSSCIHQSRLSTICRSILESLYTF